MHNFHLSYVSYSNSICSMDICPISSKFFFTYSKQSTFQNVGNTFLIQTFFRSIFCLKAENCKNLIFNHYFKSLQNSQYIFKKVELVSSIPSSIFIIKVCFLTNADFLKFGNDKENKYILKKYFILIYFIFFPIKSN